MPANLARKLAAIVKNDVGHHLLNTYKEERLPIATWTLNISSERQ